MLGPVRAHRGLCWGRAEVLSRGPLGWGESSVAARLGESGLSHAHPTPAPVCPWALQEDELVELLAQHCYVQLGAWPSQLIRELLPSCVL